MGMLIVFGNVSRAHGETLRGTVTNQHNIAIPGLTVSLVHASLGEALLQ